MIRVVLYFVAMAAVNRIAFAGVAALLPSIPAWTLALLEGGVYLACMLVVTQLFMRYLDRQPLVSLGLQARGWLLYLLLGLALGGGLIGLVFATMAAAGWLAFEPGRPDLLPFVASALSWAALSFVEELTFRGYILQGLAQRWMMALAVAVSSVLFGLVHLVDPNVQALAIVNISVAGVFFAVAYLVTGSLWLPAGIHIGWNLTELHVLGFAGSGFSEPSLLQSEVGGPQWLTGGAFGPEGGILALAAWLLGIALLLGYRTVFGSRKNLP